MEYDALHALISIFGSGEYAINEQLFRECHDNNEDLSTLMLHLLQTTFENEPTKSNNFFRALTHDHCQDRHAILEPDLLEEACPLDNGRHDFPSTSSPASCFDKLPLEILRQIFVESLDLESLTTLRAVDSRLRSSIDLLPEYQDLVQYAPASIRAALSLEVASTMTCRTIFDALCNSTCSACDEFGAYIYLPTCRRVCRPCFTTNEDFLPVPVTHTKVFWNITSQDLVNAGTIISSHSLVTTAQVTTTRARSGLP